MRETLGFLAFMAALLGGTFAGATWFKSSQCEARYEVSEYSVFTKCMVLHEGQMVPEDRVWFERNGGQ